MLQKIVVSQSKGQVTKTTEPTTGQAAHHAAPERTPVADVPTQRRVPDLARLLVNRAARGKPVIGSGSATTAG
jgi:hypothetical protein